MLLPFWSIALATGIAAGISSGSRPVFLLWGLVALAGAGLTLLRRVVLGGALLALALGATLGGRAAGPADLPAELARVAESGHEVAVRARWVRTARFEQAPDRTGERVLADLVSVEGTRAGGRLLVHLRPGQGGPLPGDLIAFRARLSRPAGLANPGLPDPRLRNAASGIDLVATPARSEALTLEMSGAWLNPRRLAHRARVTLARVLKEGVEGRSQGLLLALVLGDRFAAGEQVEAAFKAAGALHVLSVSGLHLTAIAGVLFLIIRRTLMTFPRLALRVRSEVAAGLLCLPALLFYTLVTGEAVATARAALMGALGFGAVVLRRSPSSASAIAGAAAVLLLDSPLLLLDLSFQLSFAGVIALALVARAWRSGDVRPAGPLATVRRWLARGAAASVGASFVTAPLCAHHFAEIAPASPLGNLLLVPPLELAALPLGLAGCLLGTIHPAAGLVPLQLAGAVAAASLWLADGFARWAPLVAVTSPHLGETVFLLLGTLLILSAAGGPPQPRRLLAGGLALALGAGAIATRLALRRWDPDLRVTFLDVGQGDAALVEGPGGFAMVIDGGGAVSGSFDPGARVVGPVLRRKGIHRLDLVALSHPHPDHMNGLFHLLERFDVGAVWTPGEGGGNPEYDRLVALARARGVPIAEPRTFVEGPLAVQARGPMFGQIVHAPPGLSVNDASLVLRVGFAGRWFLFSGDIEEQGEAELAAEAAADPVRSDVLKVPHHGSRTSSSDVLLDTVAPSLAVVSLGTRNRFGFPRAEVLARYASRGIKLLRTDWHGAITVRVRREGDWHVTCARSCR
jgi:competence protein ComEC